MFDALGAPRAAIEDHLARAGDRLVALGFSGRDAERGFGERDADLVHAFANAPAQGRLPVAIVSGSLRGADLALALACPIVVMERAALMATGYGRPGSAAVYVLAARHVGAVACERLLFGAERLTAERAGAAHLASVVEAADDALPLAANRLSTMISVAQANLVTWPFDRAKAAALVDPS